MPTPYLHADYLAVHYVCPNWKQAGAIADFFFAGQANDPVDWKKISTRTKYGRVWEYGVSSCYGGKVLWDNTPDGVHLCLVAKGETLARIANLPTALEFGAQYYSHCSRCDLALDNLDLSSLRAELLAAVKQSRSGNVRNFAYHCSGTAQEQFETVQLGSRDSAMFARIYDKIIAGERFTRFEIELKRELATGGYQAIVSGKLPEYYFSCLAKWEFFTEKKSKNLDRNVQLPCWLEFLDGARKTLVEKHARPTTIARSLDWLDRQVGRTLARLKKFFGMKFPEVLGSIIDRGDSKLREIDYALIRHEKLQLFAAF